MQPADDVVALYSTVLQGGYIWSVTFTGAERDGKLTSQLTLGTNSLTSAGGPVVGSTITPAGTRCKLAAACACLSELVLMLLMTVLVACTDVSIATCSAWHSGTLCPYH
jgi:hypothetical protein